MVIGADGRHSVIARPVGADWTWLRPTATYGYYTFFRRSAGPGWALIGDAGHHKDPLVARGIADAFRDAAVLAETVTQYWDSGLDEAVAACECRRDRDARPLAEASLAIAALDQPGSVLAERWRSAAALEQQLGT
jgi:2-polyprenyl-6-methoxyphenol hydroxylase-like FAD-dependent oxidoreductase